MLRLEDVCKKASSNIAQNELTGKDGEYPIYGASGLIKYVDFYQQDKPYIAIVKDGAGVGRVMKLPAYSSVIGTMQYIIPNDNVDVSYLAYALEHMNLSKYYTGATIPHIYFKDYKSEVLPDDPLEIQREIAYNLDKVSEAIDLCQKILDKLDFLVKAKFAEMFGDANTNPFNWKTETIADVCSSIVRGPFGSALKKEFFVPKGDNTYKVYEQKHAIQKSADIGSYYVSGEKYKELQRFECKAGDILMSCSGTMGEFYRLPQGCEAGIINQALCKFTLNQKLIPVVFLAIMNRTIQNLETKGSGIQNIAAVSYVKQLPIYVPPLPLQEQFAEYVKKTDLAKSAVKKTLEKAETLKNALMQKYFG